MQAERGGHNEDNNSSFATIAERVAFLHEYVSFRRTYESLDFDILFHSHSGSPCCFNLLKISIRRSNIAGVWPAHLEAKCRGE